MTDAASRGRTAELRAMEAYVDQAPAHGHRVHLMDVTDFSRIGDCDACFLRLDTSVLGLSFAASRYAWQRGLRTVDDPRSILVCMNKAHVQGLLDQFGIRTPDTILLTAQGRRSLDPDAIFTELGSPVVVKAPSSAFSAGVEKAADGRELSRLLRRFGQRSDVVLLQRFTPSTFDWRVGLLCGEPLYAARYHMPTGAWRIHDRPEGESRRRWARVERIAVADVPEEVLDTARAAAATVGNGLYGVDLKETADGVVVIEINDNPNMDWGQELPADSDVYGRIIDRIVTEGPRA